MVVKESDQRIEALLDVNTRYSIETVLPYTCLIFQDDSNRSLLSEKKFSKECIRCCVLQNKTMSSIEVGEVTKLLFHNLWCSNFLMRGRGSWKPIWLLIFQKCTLLYIFYQTFDTNFKFVWYQLQNRVIFVMTKFNTKLTIWDFPNQMVGRPTSGHLLDTNLIYKTL